MPCFDLWKWTTSLWRMNMAGPKVSFIWRFQCISWIKAHSRAVQQSVYCGPHKGHLGRHGVSWTQLQEPLTWCTCLILSACCLVCMHCMSTVNNYSLHHYNNYMQESNLVVGSEALPLTAGRREVLGHASAPSGHIAREWIWDNSGHTNIRKLLQLGAEKVGRLRPPWPPLYTPTAML